MTIKIKCYSALLLTASTSLVGCQSIEIVAPQTTPQDRPIMIMKADIPDSDGDGVFDDIDECPQTLLYTVIDAKGCPVVVYTGSLEMQLQGFFEPMSSQLSEEYDEEFAIIERNIAEHSNDYSNAKVFIFGHMASNELAITPNKNNLSRSRAINVRNRLVQKYKIDSDRISTYDCSNRYPFIATNFSESDLEGIESKDRRVTVRASTQVSDLATIKNTSDQKNYAPYIKRCKMFE